MVWAQIRSQKIASNSSRRLAGITRASEDGIAVTVEAIEPTSNTPKKNNTTAQSISNRPGERL